MTRGTRRWPLLAIVMLVFTACERTPQTVFSPQGPIARKENTLFVVTIAIAAVIFVLVEGAVLYAALRFRHRPGSAEEPVQVHGNTRLEIGWTIAPAALLAVIAVPTVATLFSISENPRGSLPVTVIGHQWWWEYRYPQQNVITANEMHIPTGRAVRLTLDSQEPRLGPNSKGVIHSFWVPALAGKTDVIPGHANKMTIQADHPGEYLGQCAEFCGLSHANMRLRVISESPAAFARWITEQRRAAAKPPSGDAAAGAALFTSKGCIGCHTLDTGAGNVGATVGPNLTHLQSRGTFAGAIFEMNPENLARWLADPPARKPGSIMPNLHLTPDEIRQLVAYLGTLQ
jgi:cytochrome c oxidase subunit 2